MRNKIVIGILSVMLGVALMSCSTFHKKTKSQSGQNAGDAMGAIVQQDYTNNRALDRKDDNNLPDSVKAALLTGISIEQPAKAEKVDRHFDITVNNVPAKAFFMGLVKGTDYNMVISPNVQGNVTFNLKKVTMIDALNAARDNYGYQYEKTSYGFHIYPPGLETRIFTIDYLDISRSGSSSTQVSSGQISQHIGAGSSSGSESSATLSRTSSGANVAPTSSIETNSEPGFWKQLKTTLDTMVGSEDGHKIVINSAAGIVIVRAYPDELKEISKYIDSVQSTMKRQVILEAKILEVELTKGFKAGIDWSVLGTATADTNGIRQTGTSNLGDNLGAFTQIFTLRSTYKNAFSAVIELLSTQGNVQTLSSPRIATLNNQKAIIKVGTDQFFITNVSSSTLSSSSTETTQDVEFTPFFSGISLDVTPQIDAKGEITLHLHPMISTVSQDDVEYTLNNESQSLPMALSQIRESDNVVRAKNGQVVVIGGLIENKTNEHLGSTPVLGKAPIIGPLFRKTNQSATKTELVILLRPIVVGDNVWTERLREEAKRMKKVTMGFHVGTHLETFGNKAELQ